MITWRRRYFSRSACGSSRVLMIGRLSVVSSADLGLEEVGALADLVRRTAASGSPLPTLPAPQKMLRVITKNGVSVLDDLAERRRGARSGSSRDCRTSCPCRSLLFLWISSVWPARQAARSRAPRRLHRALARRARRRSGRGAFGDFRRRVLRVRVVDVERAPFRSVLLRRDVLLLVGRVLLALDVEAARVGERVLLLVVPRGSARPRCPGRR